MSGVPYKIIKIVFFSRCISKLVLTVVVSSPVTWPGRETWEFSKMVILTCSSEKIASSHLSDMKFLPLFFVFRTGNKGKAIVHFFSLDFLTRKCKLQKELKNVSRWIANTIPSHKMFCNNMCAIWLAKFIFLHVLSLHFIKTGGSNINLFIGLWAFSG